MRPIKQTLLLVAAFSAIEFFSAPLCAQIDVEDKVKDKSLNRADQKTDEGIDKSLDAVEDGVKSLFKNKPKKEKDKKETNNSTGENSYKGKTENIPANNPPKQEQPALASYSKFDFIPGEKVIFYDDFSQGNVGDLPALWFSNGSVEVVTLNKFQGRWMNITGEGCYYPESDLQTIENFTAEFDLIPTFEEGMSFNLGFYVISGNIKDPNQGGAIPGVAGVKTTITSLGIDLAGYSEGNYTGEASGQINLISGEKIHLSYWIQKQRLRIYVDEKKVVDAPRILASGFKYNILRFENGREFKPYIANFRVAAGLPDIRSKLITEGKLVTYGIYFDVNSDKVKPESFGTLKGIAQVLTENTTVKVKIIGHTDGDGDAAKNLDLSKRRAASVKAELAKSFAIDASRIETDGKGKTEPIAPNDTPANKAQNRRVEFIKL